MMYDWAEVSLHSDRFTGLHLYSDRFTGLHLWHSSPSRSIQLVRSCGVLASLLCGQYSSSYQS